MRHAFYLSILLHLVATTGSAQPEVDSSDTDVEESSAVELSGSFALSADAYGTTGDSTFGARSDPFTGRLVGRLSVRLFDQIDLPFEAYLSTDDVGYRQPFNQFGVSPRLFGWMTLHAGWFGAKTSDLSFGDTRMVGGGVELSPGPFRFSLLHGFTQLAREPDSALGAGSPWLASGVYRRQVTVGKIGLQGEAAHGSINVLRAIDDTGSIEQVRYGEDTTRYAVPTPVENFLASIVFGISPFKALRLEGEFAASAFSQDVESDVLDDQPFIEPFFVTRASSRFDYAFRGSASIRPSGPFSLRLNGEWVGPGFRTLGYANLPADAMQITGSPALRLMEGELFLSGTLGFRSNNLREQKLAPSTRLVTGVNASWQASQLFGLDANWSSYAFESDHVNDTLRMNNVYNSLTVGPRFTFTALGGQNVANLSTTWQTTEDLNPITDQGINDVLTLNATHSLVKESGLSFATSFLYTNSKSAGPGSGFSTGVISIGETVSKNFLDGKLSANASGSIGFVSNSSEVVPGNRVETSDRQYLLRAGGGYQVSDAVALGLQTSYNVYSSGTAGRPSFGEIRAGLSMSISW